MCGVRTKSMSTPTPAMQLMVTQPLSWTWRPGNSCKKSINEPRSWHTSSKWHGTQKWRMHCSGLKYMMSNSSTRNGKNCVMPGRGWSWETPHRNLQGTLRNPLLWWGFHLNIIDLLFHMDDCNIEILVFRSITVFARTQQNGTVWWPRFTNHHWMDLMKRTLILMLPDFRRHQMLIASSYQWVLWQHRALERIRLHVLPRNHNPMQGNFGTT